MSRTAARKPQDPPGRVSGSSASRKRKRKSDQLDLAPASSPTTFRELAERLQLTLASLSPGHRLVANEILTDPEGCAFMSISDLATVAGVDQSTVTRFASKIGLPGYPALARLCREHLREQAQTVSRLDRLQELASADPVPPPPDVAGSFMPLDSIAGMDRANIVRTFARISKDDWASAVDACATGRSVYVIGLRKCYAIAYLLRYLLGLIREDVHQVSPEAGLFPDSLRRISSEDTCIAVSIHRYTRLTVQGLRFAKQRGATTIALTDNRASPLARYADIVFYVDSSSVSVLRSLTAFTSLAQALVAAVALRRGTQARSALLLEEDVLSQFDVFAAEPHDAQLRL